MWPEVETAKKEGRHELVCSGPATAERVRKDGLCPGIFELTTLNYLDVHEAALVAVPTSIERLVNLQTLVLHSNELTEVPASIVRLDKLKMLDLSRNKIERLPVELAGLHGLTTLNISMNRLVEFPRLDAAAKLQVLNLADNKLTTFPDVCYASNVALTDIKVNSNGIEGVPCDVRHLSALKNLDVGDNKIKEIPGELVDCSKLKEVNFKGNPISDRRLLKLIDQCRTKQVLDYVRQHGKRTTSNDADSKGGGKKGKKGGRKTSESGVEPTPNEDGAGLPRITVRHCTDDTPCVVIRDDVRKVRGHILACIMRDVDLAVADNLRKFIQMQSRLHDGVCEKRNAATIATHDLGKIGNGNLTYTARPPKQLKIKPLNRNGVSMTGEELFARLQAEAEALRKEKKRNVYSGIHKYLYLLEGQKTYPCLINGGDEIISFPPITNSDVTKISAETKSILVEVTSATSQFVCKKVLDAFLRETVALFELHDLLVEQVKIVDVDGNLKSVYPSKADLVFENGDGGAPIAVVRE